MPLDVAGGATATRFDRSGSTGLCHSDPGRSRSGCELHEPPLNDPVRNLCCGGAFADRDRHLRRDVVHREREDPGDWRAPRGWRRSPYRDLAGVASSVVADRNWSGHRPGRVVAASGAIRRALFEVQPLDPVTIAAAVALLGWVALIAGWLPAWRASRVDPVSTLSAANRWRAPRIRAAAHGSPRGRFIVSGSRRSDVVGSDPLVLPTVSAAVAIQLLEWANPSREPARVQASSTTVTAAHIAIDASAITSGATMLFPRIASQSRSKYSDA